MAIDGSDSLTAANPDDPDSFFPGTEEHGSYDLLHLNALYVLIRYVYTKLPYAHVIQKADEQATETLANAILRKRA